MKEEILKLRSEGKTYSEICKIVGCSKSTIAYHCSPEQKNKKNERMKLHRKEHAVHRKVESFKRKISTKSSNFQGRKERIKDFNPDDVIEKFGEITNCYLTGDKIDLRESQSYHFDHIIPSSRGGQNNFENLGITTSKANQAKGDMLVQEFVELCKKVVTNNGYTVIQNG